MKSTVISKTYNGQTKCIHDIITDLMSIELLLLPTFLEEYINSITYEDIPPSVKEISYLLTFIGNNMKGFTFLITRKLGDLFVLDRNIDNKIESLTSIRDTALLTNFEKLIQYVTVSYCGCTENILKSVPECDNIQLAHLFTIVNFFQIGKVHELDMKNEQGKKLKAKYVCKKFARFITKSPLDVQLFIDDAAAQDLLLDFQVRLIIVYFALKKEMQKRMMNLYAGSESFHLLGALNVDDPIRLCLYLAPKCSITLHFLPEEKNSRALAYYSLRFYIQNCKSLETVSSPKARMTLSFKEILEINNVSCLVYEEKAPFLIEHIDSICCNSLHYDDLLTSVGFFETLKRSAIYMYENNFEQKPCPWAHDHLLAFASKVIVNKCRKKADFYVIAE